MQQRVTFEMKYNVDLVFVEMTLTYINAGKCGGSYGWWRASAVERDLARICEIECRSGGGPIADDELEGAKLPPCGLLVTTRVNAEGGPNDWQQFSSISTQFYRHDTISQVFFQIRVVAHPFGWSKSSNPPYKKLKWAPSSFLLSPYYYCGLGAGSIPFRAIVNNKQCEIRGLFMSLIIHYWKGDVRLPGYIRLRCPEWHRPTLCRVGR